MTPIPANNQPARDWELTCDHCDGCGRVIIQRQVAERKSDVQEFKEECECCEGRGFVFAFDDIPGIEQYVKSCRPASVAPGDAQTPGATWRAKGEADPHGDRYKCERAALTMGDLTDDELANGAFMNYDRPLDIEALMQRRPGYHSPIAWMTAVKDRIRWLSRKLEEAQGAPAAGDAQAAVRSLQRYGFGYADDGNGARYLSSLKRDDGAFLRRDEVLAALAAQVPQQGEA